MFLEISKDSEDHKGTSIFYHSLLGEGKRVTIEAALVPRVSQSAELKGILGVAVHK